MYIVIVITKDTLISMINTLQKAKYSGGSTKKQSLCYVGPS